MTPQTPAEKIAALEARVNYLELSIPQFLAFMRTAQTFFDKHEEREETLEQIQAERHRENQAKIDEVNTKLASRSLWVNVAAFLVGLASLAVAILAIVVMVKLANHSMSDVIHIFVSNHPNMTEALLQSRY